MQKKLSVGVLVFSFILLLSLSLLVYRNNSTIDSANQLAAVAGPSITNVSTNNISASDATISWKTNTISNGSAQVKKSWESTWSTPITESSSSTTHSIKITNLVAKTAYNFKVTSCDTTSSKCTTYTSSSKFTTTSTDTIAPTTPTNVTASNITQTSATISWTASTDNVGVVGYYLYKDGATAAINTTIVTGTSYSASGLTVGNSRSYAIRAVDAAGNMSALSNSVTFSTLATPDTTTPSVPTNVTASNITQTSATISWTASTDNVGVVGYNVYLGTATTPVNATLITNTTYSITGLNPSTTYSFKVKAKDAAGNLSSTSSAASFTTPALIDSTAPSAPTSLSLISKTYNTVAFSWAASTDNVGVTSYEVFANGTSVGTTITATSITVPSLASSTPYSFTVKAKDAAGNISVVSATLSVTTDAIPDTQAPTTPTNLISSNLTASSVDIAWSPSTDNVAVIEYQVYANDTLIGGTTSATSIHVSGLLENTLYRFKITSKDAAQNYSQPSDILPITTLLDIPSTPTLSLISKTYNSIAISWTASTDTGSTVTSYEIYEGDLYLDSTTTATSITASNLTGSTTYHFTVKAKNALGHVSNISDVLTVTTDTTPDTTAPTAPTGLNTPAEEVTTNSLNLYWTASTDNVGVVEYQVYLNGILIGGTTSATSIPVTGLLPSTDYAFTITAKDGAGNISPLSTSLSVTTKTPADTTAPTVPTNVTASNITQTSVTISWTASTDNVGVVGYNTYKNNTTTPSNTSTITGTTRNTTGLSAGTLYSYKIAAVDAAGNVSALSNPVSFTTASAADTTAPTISTITSTPTVNGVTITWTTNEASDSQISYGTTTSYGTTSVLDPTLSTSHSVTVTGLNPSTTYHFKVTSKDAAVNSASSTDQSFTTTTTTTTGGCLNTVTNPADERHVWAWHQNTDVVTPNSTYQNQFFNYVDNHHITIAYVSLNTSFFNSTTNKNNLKDFLNKARAHCLLIEALSGAENWVALPGNGYFTQGVTTTAALDWAHTIVNFNSSITAGNATLYGLQYDVEPHTIKNGDGYYPYWNLADTNYTANTANQAIINSLIDMSQAVRAITAGSGLKLDIAPPRWYDTSDNLTPFSRTGFGVTGKNAMQYLFDTADILSIQDYVNTASNIYNDAQGELNYAAATGKKLRIGILLDDSAPATSNFYGSTCANLNSTLQAAYNMMTATEKNGFGGFAIEQYDEKIVTTNGVTTGGYPSSWTGMCQ